MRCSMYLEEECEINNKGWRETYRSNDTIDVIHAVLPVSKVGCILGTIVGA